jgi:hypothetical protein
MIEAVVLMLMVLSGGEALTALQEGSEGCTGGEGFAPWGRMGPF